MKKFLIIFIFLISTNKLSAQSTLAQKFFPKEKLIETGVYYYPEHWPEEQWERDLSNISKMGFEFTHFAEFAWQNIEPEEGKYNFEWLDKAVSLAAKNNLKVIMCTPSPTPPAWLAAKHPEIFLWDNNYRPREHASRGNYSTSSDIYWRYTEKIVEALSKRYGNDKRIWGWQLDNEPGAPEDYSPAAQEKFRSWLKNKYQTIDNLNKQWGNAFWGVTYNDFSQIRIPNRSFLYGIGPHVMLDYRRFLSQQQASYLHFQADIIRKHANPSQWITTNLINVITGLYARDLSNLDFVSYTVYPAGGGRNLGELGFRLGSSHGISFASPFFKNIKGATGVMELQPGQVNWAQINPQPLPGAVHMWLWHAYAAGASFACTYRFRQPLYGSEQYHAGIVGTDGVTPSQGGKEYQQFITEINQLRKQYDEKVHLPEDWQIRKTGIMWSHENLWDMENHKQTAQWSTYDHMYKYLYAVLSNGAPLDIISEDHNLSDYKVVIAPAYQLLDAELVNKWRRYVEQGGNLILTSRTGQKDRMGHLWEGKWATPITDLIGAEIKLYDLLLPDGAGKITMDGEEYIWNNWADVLIPTSATKVATYSNHFYQGDAAITVRKLGKGTVTYIGADTDDGKMERDIVRKTYENIGAAPENYPEGVLTYFRDGFFITVNYSSENREINLKQGDKVIFGERQLKPAGVLVWKRK